MAVNVDDPRMRETICDFADIASYVAANPGNDFGPNARAMVDAAMRCDDYAGAAWRKLARWVLFVTNWNERYRPLTDDEQRYRRIADRLLDACDRAMKPAKGN